MASTPFHDDRFITKRSLPVQAVGFVAWIAVAFVAAGVGALASIDAGTFYEKLTRPTWAPPAYVFGPVWTILYLLMGIAAWLAWRTQNEKGSRVALSLFIVQLIANALWSWLFFGWRMGALAFVDVLILLTLVAATTFTFWRVQRWAGLLFIPYLAWVSFAAALTFAVWQGNPNQL